MHASREPQSLTPDRRLTRAEWNIIWLLVGAVFVLILNETTMSLALPALDATFGLTPAISHWATTGFILTMAILIPVSGFLLQKFTTRQVFLTAMTLFSVGTAIAGLAPEFWVLLIGRVIQASGTATMMPLLMTTIMTLVPPSQRGAIMGNVTIAISVAPAIGPTLSGVILQYLSWRWIYGVVFPIALIALVLGFLWLKNVGETRSVAIDPLSIALSALGFGGLIFALSTLSGTAGNLTLTIAAFVVGTLGLAGFTFRQFQLQPVGRPLLDLRIFRSPNFRYAAATMTITFGTMIGMFVLIPQYLLKVKMMPEMSAGVLLLPGGIIMGVMGPLVGRAYDKVGPRPLAIPGAVLFTVMLFVMTTVTAQTPDWLLVTIHIAMMIGLGLLFTPMFTTGLGSLEPRLYPHGSAMLGTLQQVGAAAGTALLVTLMTLTNRAELAAGTTEPLALNRGVSFALLVAAFISIAAVVMVSLVGRVPAQSRPSDAPEEDHAPAEAAQSVGVAPATH